MAYILGTAGHVDHGKTALVKCLTGVETSHIPEEKKRGMTIELGFAALQDPEHGTVGIVDVPGHERFIRNMVSGTWGLDAALLIVAADDGWMQMSQDHLRVLKAMHIDSILLVITKADLADESLLELIQEGANRQCEAILGKTLPCVAVSALTGFGIETLKQKITELLGTVQKKEQDKPFLYIDRVFNLKGIGSTVTGTLRGKGIKTGDSLLLYPGNTECRIKTIQNHHTEVPSSEAGMRTALNIKTVEKNNLARGMLLAGKGESPILEGKELLIRLDEYFSVNGNEKPIKNHSELEIALGSTHAIGSIHINKNDESLARLSLQQPVACGWNQPAVLIRHGGSTILASCRILAAFDRYQPPVFRPLFAVYAGRELSTWKSCQFYTEGFIEKTGTERQELSSDNKEIILCGNWWLYAAKLAEWEEMVQTLAKKNAAGFTAEELAAIPLKIRADLLKKLCADNTALQAGFAGIEIDKIQLPQARKDARDLVTMGKLVVLENFLHYHRDIYDKAVAAILKGKQAGDAFGIADARTASGLSRKYIIPLLNAMEKDGKVKRNGNDRIVL